VVPFPVPTPQLYHSNWVPFVEKYLPDAVPVGAQGDPFYIPIVASYCIVLHDRKLIIKVDAYI
jgi:hypothetical protein